MPYDYDAVMGITRVGTREAEGFDEDLDSTEYHDANDATEEPIRKEETEADSQVQTSTGFQGGYGSSSLKECIELLSTTNRNTPAPLDSGVGESTGPPHEVAAITRSQSSGSVALTDLGVVDADLIRFAPFSSSLHVGPSSSALKWSGSTGGAR